MSDSHRFPENSVGLVAPQTLRVEQPLALQSGRSLPGYQLVYETYGTLNANRSNAILVCHALSGNHHAAGYHSETDKKPGWWDSAIGPGKPIDTNLFFVVSLNNIGGCSGSTGPVSENPATGKQYGADFPLVVVEDWVCSQVALSDHLQIDQWSAIVGASLGAMQVLQWSIDYPHRLKNALVIAAAPKLTAQNIAFNEVARHAIRTDPAFHDGRYAEHNTLPETGLSLARMLGHITYLSDKSMDDKFGRELRSPELTFDYNANFQVESYLRYQGKAFVGRFDANTYLLMTKALDYFDPAKAYGDDLTRAMQQASAKFLVVSFSSDWRFSPARSREIVHALIAAGKHVSYAEIQSDLGHDDFLMPIPQYFSVLTEYLRRVAEQC